MKTKITLVIAILFSIISIAQNEFNYKAIIKDATGNILANATIQVQFTILEDQIPVYSESHSTTTDANGLIIINIGGGTAISGNFDTISYFYYTDQYNLNVQIDTGSGLVDMGTTPLKAVPYAAYAAHSPDNARVIFPRFNETFSQSWQILGDGRFRITLDFNICINLDTMYVGDNFTVIGAGGSATGTITFAYGGTRVVFTSNEQYSSIAPCFSGGINLTLWGSGSNPILDTNGRPLDGNMDGHVGGQFTTNFDYIC
ncbi:hypothetical protein [Xanthomarina sp. F2636L]|uniref:hypothetical protein n=1 Tax=Xanthomarina sp. F2636L TaxID=2996018 RepID=UPI00225DE55A|nr:hypothetical protein [Xanthomarina sp. F2636L]MCX7550482.1 hypothetical protein [Xanthomarina sp. F2636L]